MIFDYMFGVVLYSEDYRLWTKGWPPEANAMAYFTMVEERTHATRLEF